MAAVIIVDVEVNGFVENADEVFDRRRVVADRGSPGAKSTRTASRRKYQRVGGPV
jgi:hypothetical protein